MAQFLEVNWVPWSHWMRFGGPYNGIYSLNNLLIVIFAVAFLIGYIETYFVNVSSTTRRYLTPPLPVGKGPQKSMDIKSFGPSGITGEDLAAVPLVNVLFR